MSKFVFPLDKVSAPDTELLELGFPLYCRPENQFQHANIQHPSERCRTCRDGSYKYLCVCLWLKCWLRTFALTYSYNCISWSGSGHEITPPSHDTDAGALLQAALVTLFLMVAKCKDELCKIHFNCYVFFGLCSETCLLWIFYKSLITQLGVLGLTLLMGITHHKHVNIFIIHVVIK